MPAVITIITKSVSISFIVRAPHSLRSLCHHLSSGAYHFGGASVDISWTFFYYVHIIASISIHWMKKQLPRNCLETSEKHELKELRRNEFHLERHYIACARSIFRRAIECARMCETNITSLTHEHVPIHPIDWILFFAKQTCWLCRTINCTRLLNSYRMCQTHLHKLAKQSIAIWSVCWWNGSAMTCFWGRFYV